MEREATVRGLFAAYLANRKDEVSDMLTEDFTFSSPRDDHIDKAAYFERWLAAATGLPCHSHRAHFAGRQRSAGALPGRKA